MEKKQPKPYTETKEQFISMGKEAKQEQKEMLEKYRKVFHYCEYDTFNQIYGDAVKYCYEDNKGLFWTGNNEYESQVNFCPFCGAKASVQAIELHEISEKGKKRVSKMKYALKIDNGDIETRRFLFDVKQKGKKH